MNILVCQAIPVLPEENLFHLRDYDTTSTTLISILNLTASILGFLKELSNQDKICDQRNIPVYLNKL